MTITAAGTAKRDAGFIRKAEEARTALAGTYPDEWNQLPRTRKEAQVLGLAFYFGAQACKQGHIALRQTAKGVCEECHRAYRTGEAGHAAQRKRYAQRMELDPSFAEANRANSKRHYHRVMKNDEERMARHYARVTEYQKENRERFNANRRAFNARNPGYGREHVVARRASIRHSQLSTAEQSQVKAIYRLRIALTRATGIDYHVDHHIPLAKGGKHHPDNLWVIPAADNLRKGAKLPSELAA